MEKGGAIPRRAPGVGKGGSGPGALDLPHLWSEYLSKSLSSTYVDSNGVPPPPSSSLKRWFPPSIPVTPRVSSASSVVRFGFHLMVAPR